MRTIGVVTVGRSDFGIYLPVLKRMRESSRLRTQIIAAAAQLAQEPGQAVNEITRHGFAVDARVPMTRRGDSREDIASGAGDGLVGFTRALKELEPDLILVLGDRFEMLMAALAATFAGIPLAHIHGGELSMGAWDDALRHSITKLSHLHFVSTCDHARRVRQLGEEAWRVKVTGAPSLDNIGGADVWSRAKLERFLGMQLRTGPLLVTFHPITMQLERTAQQVDTLVEILTERAENGQPIVITRPNADPANLVIVARFAELAARHSHVRFLDNLGTEAYFNVMWRAVAMLGNSSSGIVEAASFELPVVNVGDRQAGRTRSGNVLDVGFDPREIRRALDAACSPEFKRSLAGLRNVYGDGLAAPRIVNVLESVELNDRLRVKQFVDWREAA